MVLETLFFPMHNESTDCFSANETMENPVRYFQALLGQLSQLPFANREEACNSIQFLLEDYIKVFPPVSIKTYTTLFSALRECAGFRPYETDILEIGPGFSLGLIFLAALSGARKTWAADLFPHDMGPDHDFIISMYAHVEKDSRFLIAQDTPWDKDRLANEFAKVIGKDAHGRFTFRKEKVEYLFPYSGDNLVYSLAPDGTATGLLPESVTNRQGKNLYLPVSDWHLNRDSLCHPAAEFVSPDGTAILPVGKDFLTGATSWGIKSSPQIRSFGLAKATPGRPFYVTDESALRTWKADVNPDASLTNFQLFAEQGGEGVTSDANGNVYIAAGQIYVYTSAGKAIETIEVPERPTQLVFGGPDHKTLFIPARASLYSVRLR